MDAPVLQGRLVRLEPLSLEHIPALVAAATEDRSTYDFTLVPEEGDGTAAYVASALDEMANSQSVAYATFERDRVVGSTRFLDLEYWDASAIPSVAEIGSTWLAASAQRTGVNIEAKLLMLSHAFEMWHVHRVTFKTDARNERSRKAIERIGATFEGIRRAHRVATDGTIRNSAYYSIIASEWPLVKQQLQARIDR